MARSVLFACFLCCLSAAIAQNDNLVLNPGFEQLKPDSRYPDCGYAPNSHVFNNAVAEWNTWDGLTPDLITWKPDQFGDCFFPKPNGGDHAIGIITYLPGVDLGRLYDFHELVQGKLRFPLVPGKTYQVSFFIQQADSVAIDHLQRMYGEKQKILPTAAGNLGICFFNNRMNWLPTADEAKPQVLFKDPIVTPQGEWLKLEASFVPDRPFLYFSIGNFFKDKNTPTTLQNSDEVTNFNLAQLGFAEKKKRVAYYLLDDLSVVPIEKPKPKPASMIAELKKKKAYTFRNVNFETGKWDLLPEAISELDSLADLLKKIPSMKLEIGGHTDNVGDDEANRLLSEHRAAAVHQYLMAQGIDQNRLSFRGYGESMPVDDNATPAGRAINRRVACKVLP